MICPSSFDLYDVNCDFVLLVTCAISDAQCLGKSRSERLHCSSQIVVMIFFASFDISSLIQVRKLHELKSYKYFL